MLAKLMESQIWHQLAGSVGGGFRKGIMASACLDARHFIFSLYATGAFEAATPDLELRRGESVGGVFKRNYLVSQKLWGLTFLALESWARGLVWAWDSLLLMYPSRIFTYVGVGPARSECVPLLPVWMEMVSSVL